MTALWIIVGWVATCLALVFVCSVGAYVREQRTNRHWRQLSAELDAEWRQLFVELGEDHGRELQQVEDQLAQREDDLARADATIDMLRRNDGLAFMAGQMLRMDREEYGLD